jgi:hypothetical protein
VKTRLRAGAEGPAQGERCARNDRHQDDPELLRGREAESKAIRITGTITIAVAILRASSNGTRTWQRHSLGVIAVPIAVITANTVANDTTLISHGGNL